MRLDIVIHCINKLSRFYNKYSRLIAVALEGPDVCV